MISVKLPPQEDRFNAWNVNFALFLIIVIIWTIPTRLIKQIFVFCKCQVFYKHFADEHRNILDLVLLKKECVYFCSFIFIWFNEKPTGFLTPCLWYQNSFNEKVNDKCLILMIISIDWADSQSKAFTFREGPGGAVDRVASHSPFLAPILFFF